ncbi:MAG: endonuclease/exonuclease/phosphatase family protein [Planctomycetaceae bacterium]|nr:endonuclease/exonuclease/phosphatase family protein [Planctomycetaceae bacterium]
MSSHQTHLDENRAAKRWLPRSVTFVMTGLYFSGTLLWLVAILIRLTVRDLSPYPLVTVLYYATPGVLLFATAGLLMFFAGVLGRSRTAATWCIMGLVVAQCAGSHHPVPAPSSQSQQTNQVYRLLLWNVCHGRQGWDNIASEINKHQADIIALVEAGDPSEQMRTFWKEQFPEYDTSLLGGEMVLLTRGQSTEVRARKIGREGQVREVDLILNGHAVTTMVVDIHGRLDIPRGESIQDLANLMKHRKSQPVLIAGDFNTPKESPLFQPLRQQSSNAFEVAGQGYSPTWPWMFPVLVIDQVWSNDHITFDSSQNIWSKASDHCAILTEFHFK